MTFKKILIGMQDGLRTGSLVFLLVGLFSGKTFLLTPSSILSVLLVSALIGVASYILDATDRFPFPFGQRVSPAHAGVGHVVIEQGDARHGQGQLHELEQRQQALPGVAGHVALRGGQPEAGLRGHIAGDGQAGAHEQRPQGERGPIHQQALAQGAGLAHAPDGVQGVIDREQQRQGGKAKHGQADRDRKSVV